LLEILPAYLARWQVRVSAEELFPNALDVSVGGVMAGETKKPAWVGTARLWSIVKP
jgi:hypothetical protein